MDHEKQIYNLDHHEGCVRSFTLAACEQALVLSMKGLDLREREWNILANEPDLDTVLAIWILLNHRRIQNREFTNRQRLLTLVRLQGTIDSLGLELKEFSGLPPELSKTTQRLIDHLRREEIRLKKDALWDEIGFLDYTADILHQIDRMIYRPSDFSDFQEIKELAHRLEQRLPDPAQGSARKMSEGLIAMTEQIGDGLVSVESARLPGVPLKTVQGTHLSMIRNLTSTGPLYFSFPTSRSATLIFDSPVEGSFLVRYESGQLTELIEKVYPQGEIGKLRSAHQHMTRVTRTRASTSSIVGNRSPASLAKTLIALKNSVPMSMWRMPGVRRRGNGERGGTGRGCGLKCAARNLVIGSSP